MQFISHHHWSQTISTVAYFIMCTREKKNAISMNQELQVALLKGALGNINIQYSVPVAENESV